MKILKLINEAKQIIRFYKVAKCKGWYQCWVESGDVVTPENRHKIRSKTAEQYIKITNEILDGKG
jgi:hypothetical protein